MYTPWKQRPKQSLKVRLTVFFSSFFRTLFSHPSSKRLESRWEAEPALPPSNVCLCVCYILGVSWPGRDLKQWAAAKRQMYKKKIKILQKLTSTKHGFFYPFSSTSEITHLSFPATSWKWHSSKLMNCLLCLFSLRRSTTDIYIFNILNSLFYLFVLFIYLIHLSIYCYLFIYLLFSAVCCRPSAVRHPPSAVRIRRPFPPFTDTRQWLATRRNRRFIFSSPRPALRAKCHVRLAWLIKRLLCRLKFA